MDFSNFSFSVLSLAKSPRTAPSSLETLLKSIPSSNPASDAFLNASPAAAIPAALSGLILSACNSLNLACSNSAFSLALADSADNSSPNFLVLVNPLRVAASNLADVLSIFDSKVPARSIAFNREVIDANELPNSDNELCRPERSSDGGSGGIGAVIFISYGIWALLRPCMRLLPFVSYPVTV